MQIDQLVPWLALIVVFAGMVLIIMRCLSAGVQILNTGIQIVMLALGKPLPSAAPPAPAPAPHPTPTPPAAPVPPSLLDMLGKLAGAKPAAPAAPVPAAGPAGAPPWYTLGLRDVGFHEVGDNKGLETFIAQAHVGEEGQPWCAIWVNAKLEQAGVTGTRSASSQSFTSSPLFAQLAKPALGCIVVFWRGSRNSGQGHVGFYVSETATSINTLGGNESDAVKIEALPKSSASFGLVGYYWPKAVPVPQGGAVVAPASSLTHEVNPAPASALVPASDVGGKISTFGGPADTGMSPSEGLALVEESELPKFEGYFLPSQPAGTTGLGRRLDPASHYIAMRWDYKATSRAYLQGINVTVSANGKSLSARPVDWGPNANTGRIADLSPGLAAALGVRTDDICDISIPIPGSAPAAPKVT